MYCFHSTSVGYSESCTNNYSIHTFTMLHTILTEILFIKEHYFKIINYM